MSSDAIQIEWTPTEEIVVIDDGAPLPPQVVLRQPGGADELSVDGKIRLAFDQPMDAEKTGLAFQVTSQDGVRVTGKVTWPDERTLEYQPSAQLESGRLYPPAWGLRPPAPMAWG